MSSVTPLLIARSMLVRVSPLERIRLARDLLCAIDDPDLFAPVAEAVRDGDATAQALARRAFGGPLS